MTLLGGYAVLADAISGGLSQVTLKNKAGQAVIANTRSVSFALMELGGNLDSRGNADLMDASSTFAWPIAGGSKKETNEIKIIVTFSIWSLACFLNECCP